MKNKLTGIYIIKCGSHRYVGQSVNISKRWESHLTKLKHNKHENKILQNSFNKNGASSLEFSVLQIVDGKLLEKLDKTQIKQLLKVLEQTWMYLCDVNANLCPAAGSPLGIKRSQEFKDKVSISNKGKRAKTYQFLDENGQVVEIENLTEYAAQNNLSQTALWMLATGVKKSYAGLKCLPEVYAQKQAELDAEIEYRKANEWLYPNMCFSKHLGQVKYRVFKNENLTRWANRMFVDRQEALEFALIVSQIMVELV